MTLIKKANEIDLPNTVSILIYGNPGTGKTTMACSMPKPLIFDMDRGIHRAISTADVVQTKDIEDVYNVLNDPAIANYETLIFDTIGRLLDYLVADILKRNKQTKMRIQDYGSLKLDFDNLMAILRNKNKSVVFIAHETEEKVEVNGKTVIVKRPDTGVGNSGKSLIKDLDIIGYVRVQDKRTIISFNPDDNYYAKNGYNIQDDIIIPKIEKGNENTFFTKLITDKVKETNKQKQDELKNYNELINDITNQIYCLDNTDKFNSFLREFEKKSQINNSLIVAKKLLWQRASELNIDFNKDTKSFFYKYDKKEEVKEEVKQAEEIKQAEEVNKQETNQEITQEITNKEGANNVG
jgi:phage nucleotide-binding protein